MLYISAYIMNKVNKKYTKHTKHTEIYNEIYRL